jgi:hypothetical protein
MKILSATPRRDGKIAVRVDFTHIIRHYVWTPEKLAEVRAHLDPEPRAGQYGPESDPALRPPSAY